MDFSDKAKEEIQSMYSKSKENFQNSLKCIEQKNKAMIKNIYNVEDEVDALEKLYKKLHIERLNDGKCSIDSGVLFIDLITNLERVSDHACNIAKRIEIN